MPRLEWSRLLNTKRLRELAGGPVSVRASEETRSEFDRDYGRTIYSTPLRRLKEKTQVFPLEESDFVRTRLLHSQEVSSVAEDLASQLTGSITELKSLPEELRTAIPLVVATCGLIHDLGNPPFGHAGELALQTWFEKQIKRDANFLDSLNEQQQADFLKFEGNAHTLRIVSNMRLLVDDYGLNYTCATFSAARKYIGQSNTTNDTDHGFLKPGFFWSESQIVNAVLSETTTVNCRHPLTFLVEAADDIVYSVVDLEDGIKRKVLNWAHLQETLQSRCGDNPVFRESLELAHKQLKDANFEKTGFARDEILAQVFRISAVSRLAIAAMHVFRQRYDEIMTGEYKGELVVDELSEGRDFVENCKKYAREHLYPSAEILKLEIRGRHVIHDLMDLFWDAVQGLSGGSFPLKTKTYEGKIYHLISENYRDIFEERLKRADGHDKYYKLQLITDYVAGMTDPFACRLHRGLKNG
jgi:dGTPase